MKARRQVFSFLLAFFCILAAVPSSALAVNNELTTNPIIGKNPLSIVYPTDSQTTIAPGRDFYVIGNIDDSLVLPDGTHMEVTVTEAGSGDVVRTVYTDVKDNTEGMYVDYPNLSITGDKEAFRHAGMPDIIYDPSDPESYKNTWIKAYYNDDFFTCTVYGGLTYYDVNPYDQNGELLRPLSGDYTINVTFSDSKNVLAHIKKEITIADYPEKVLTRFDPQAHLVNVVSDAKKNNWMTFLDPFPGYWNTTMFNPEWEIDYESTIPGKWKRNDALEYAGGRVHMYIYGTTFSSTSYSVELGLMQSCLDMDNPARIDFRYYDIGEPELPANRLTGRFVTMDNGQYVAFTRVNTTADGAEGYLDMESLETVESTIDFQGTTFTIKPDSSLSVFGVTRPIQTKEISYDEDAGNYTYPNRVSSVVYKFEFGPDLSSPVAHSNTTLTRSYSDGNTVTSSLEFKHVLYFDKGMADLTDSIKIYAKPYDSYGNELGDYEYLFTVEFDK